MMAAAGASGLELSDSMGVAAAMRVYGPPELVAELDRLEDAWRTVSKFNEAAGVELWHRYLRIHYRLFEHLRDKFATGCLILTWQPADPTADRRRLKADRCPQLRLPWMGQGDTLKLDGHDLRACGEIIASRRLLVWCDGVVPLAMELVA